MVASKPSEKVSEGPRGYKRAALNQTCNRKQNTEKKMKFTQSIIAAATLYSLTQAVNVSSLSEVELEDISHWDAAQLAMQHDGQNSLAIQQSIDYCSSRRATRDWC